MYLFIIIIILASLFQMPLNHVPFLFCSSCILFKTLQEDVSELPTLRENTTSVTGNVLTLPLPPKTTGKYASSAQIYV